MPPCARQSGSWGSRKTDAPVAGKLASQAKEIVGTLASSPRFAGSDEETKARRTCASLLTDAGYSVAEETFEYSQFPSRIILPVTALLAATLSLAISQLVGAYEASLAALTAAIVGGALIVMLGRYLTGPATLAFPWGRATSVNLTATKRGAAPRIWLIAHLDSKSQTIPMLVRMVSISALVVFLGLAIVAVIVKVMIGIAGHPPRMGLMDHRLTHTVDVHAMLAALSALPLMFTFTRNKSNGALDNASGVAAALLAVRQIGAGEVGVLITSAEELGLAGARAFVASGREPAIALNCDTIDDSGRLMCMASGSRSKRLDDAVDRAARRLGVETRRPFGTRFTRLRRMLPGVLADNIAFTDAGWESFTLSRGNLGTLLRVHTSGDRADSITGTGIAQAALLISATVEELT